MENDNINKNEEHDHFLKWYQDKSDEIFTRYRDAVTGQALGSDGTLVFPEYDGKEKLADYYLKAGYSFESAFATVYYDDRNSFDHDGGADVARVFFLYRTEYFKLLNLIDALTLRICDHNIDRSVFKFGFNTKRAREAFIWHMCTSTPAMRLDVQDINRLKSFFKIQIERKLASIGKYYDHTDIQEEYARVMDSFDYNSVELEWQEMRRKQAIDIVDDFKKQLQKLINDTYDVYDCLTSYRDYLANTEFTPQKSDIKPIKHAISLAVTVKKIFTERFSSYIKIPKMSLGHSELSGVHFSRSNISESNFINSDFIYAQLDNTIANNCDFSICNFMSCDAQNATLNDCTFNYSNMTGMNLSGASLNNTTLNAVIFRDTRLDSSIGFAQALLSGDEKGMIAYVARKDELTKRNNKHTADEMGKKAVQNFHDMLARKNSDKEGSLWRLTCAADNDATAHLWVVDERGKPDTSKTIIDEVFGKSRNMLEAVESERNTKVISKYLLDMLREAERKETSDDRSYRIKKYGKICFEATTLNGADIVKCSLPEIDLSHMDVRNASFSESDLTGSIGYYTNAETAYFGGANLNNSDFYQCNFNDTSFANANCMNVMFVDSSLRSIDMNKALAIGIIIVNTQKKTPYISELLTELDESDPDRKELLPMTEYVDDIVDFKDEGLIMTESNWNRASASKSVFMNVKMDRSHFNFTDFRDFLIFNCVARWSSFERADMSYGLLIGSTFHQSIYTSSTLSQTHIYACEFSGCRMTDLILIGSRCDKVVFQDNDLSRANFSHVYFQNCIFKDCIFNGINLSKATFKHCTFSNVDFSNNCIGLASVKFIDCYFNKIKGMKGEERDASAPLSLDGMIEKRLTLFNANDGSGAKIQLVETSKDATGTIDLYTTASIAKKGK